MRSIRVTGYKKQDGTVVREHTKHIASTPSQNGISAPDTFNLLEIEDENNKQHYVQPKSLEINKKIYDLKDEMKGSLRFIDSVEGYIRRQLGNGLVATVLGSASLIFFGFTAAAGGILGGAAVIVGVPYAATTILKARNKARLKHGLRKAVHSRIPKEEIEQKLLRNPTSRKPQMSEEEKREGLSGSFHRSTNNPHDYRYNNLNDTRIKLEENGTGTILTKAFAGSESVERKIMFYPEVDLSNQIFDFKFNAPGANLQKANFSETSFEGGALWNEADLREVNLQGANFKVKSSMENADLRGANLSHANLEQVRLHGADLSGADISGIILPYSLNDITLDSKQIVAISDTLHDHAYAKVSFGYAIKELGVSEQRFEFMVMSGVIKVRDNDTRLIVDNGFDPRKHHVDVFEIMKTKEIM